MLVHNWQLDIGSSAFTEEEKVFHVTVPDESVSLVDLTDSKVWTHETFNFVYTSEFLGGV